MTVSFLVVVPPTMRGPVSPRLHLLVLLYHACVSAVCLHAHSADICPCQAPGKKKESKARGKEGTARPRGRMSSLPEPGTTKYDEMLRALLQKAMELQQDLAGRGKSIFSHGKKEGSRKEMYNSCVGGVYASHFVYGENNTQYSLAQINKLFDSAIDDYDKKAPTRARTGDAAEPRESDIDSMLRNLSEARRGAANSDNAQLKASKTDYCKAMSSVQLEHTKNVDKARKRRGLSKAEARRMDHIEEVVSRDADAVSAQLLQKTGKEPSMEQIIDTLFETDDEDHKLACDMYVGASGSAGEKRNFAVCKEAGMRLSDSEYADAEEEFTIRKPSETTPSSDATPACSRTAKPASGFKSDAASAKRTRKRGGAPSTPTDNSIEAKLVASQSDLANALRETMQEQNKTQAAMQRIYEDSEKWKKESRERDMQNQRELVLNKQMKEENAERQRKYARIMDAVKEGLLDKDAAKEMISAQGLF